MTRLENIQAHKANYKAKFLALLQQAINESPEAIFPATKEIAVWGINDLVCDLFHGAIQRSQIPLDDKVQLTPEQIVIAQNVDGAQSVIGADDFKGDDFDLTPAQALALDILERETNRTNRAEEALTIKYIPLENETNAETKDTEIL